MLRMVEAITDRGTNLLLPIGPISEGIYVKEIEGLDPVKANIVSSSFAQRDGAQYHSSRRESRNIVMKLGLELGVLPVKELRKRLYTYFMTKSQVVLRFYMTDMPTVEIVGRVESFETALFSQEPEVSISILCFDPDFYTLEKVVIDSVLSPITDAVVVEYEGTVETGILVNVFPNRELIDFYIAQQSDGDTERKLTFNALLSAGEKLEISTVSGAKGATLTRTNNQIQSMLYGITSYSAWINLYPGTNYLKFYTSGYPIPITLEYATRFGGL